MSNEAAQAVGPSPAQLKKKASTARWTKIGGVLIAVVAVVRGVSLFLPKDMPHCDDSEVQATASQLMNDVLAQKGAAGMKVKSLTGIKDGPRADKLAKCTGTITISDNSRGVLTYQIERGKGGDTVHITNVQPL